MWKRLLKEWFTFSRSEQRGVVVLGVLLLLLMVAPAVMRFSQHLYPNRYAELRQRVDSLSPLVPQLKEAPKKYFERSDRKAQVFYFNPNTIGIDSLKLLGFTQKQAESVLRYRERSGGFNKPEKFLKMAMVSQHQHLAPYIRIPQEKTQKNTPEAAQNHRHADTFEQRLIDLNTADSVLLKSLPGIGSYFAQRMVEYREKLGGYVRMEQLLEIKYFTTQKLERIKNSIYVDTANVHKMQLTEACLKQLKFHPYVGAYAARGIGQQIKYSGGSTTLKDLVKNHILSQEQAAKLQDYIEPSTH